VNEMSKHTTKTSTCVCEREKRTVRLITYYFSERSLPSGLTFFSKNKLTSLREKFPKMFYSKKSQIKQNDNSRIILD
jgi:hypothetical protein